MSRYCLVCYAFTQVVRWLCSTVDLVWTYYVVVLCATLLHKSSVSVLCVVSHLLCIYNHYNLVIVKISY